jgi:hypothetical protein
MRHALFVIYVVACISALVWPVYPAVAAAAGDLMFGVPFALAWHVLWIFATFIALALYERACHGGQA